MHTIDPNSLPHVEGTLERFLVNEHGELDGMLLRGGIEVATPPHLGAALGDLATQGQSVRVRGVRLRGAEVVVAVRVENSQGASVTDDGPPEGDAKDEREKARKAARTRRTRCTCEGTLVRFLHGPKGETRGALLDDGTTLRWPPHEGRRVAEDVPLGTSIAVRGERLDTPFGAVIEVTALGPKGGPLRDLHPKKKAGHEDGSPLRAHGLVGDTGSPNSLEEKES
jgi:hypothetical protein